MMNNPYKRLTKYCFSELFCQAWFQAMTPSNAAAGFRATGIFPFNRDTIKLPKKAECQDAAKSKPIEKGNITFLPVFSPSRSQAERRSAVFELPPVCSILEESTEDCEVCMSDSPAHLTDSSEENECAVSSLTSYQQSPDQATFTEEENEHFRKRQEEGFDITTDCRYNPWLHEPSGKHEELLRECRTAYIEAEAKASINLLGLGASSSASSPKAIRLCTCTH